MSSLRRYIKRTAAWCMSLGLTIVLASCSDSVAPASAYTAPPGLTKTAEMIANRYPGARVSVSRDLPDSKLEFRVLNSGWLDKVAHPSAQADAIPSKAANTETPRSITGLIQNQSPAVSAELRALAHLSLEHLNASGESRYLIEHQIRTLSVTFEKKRKKWGFIDISEESSHAIGLKPPGKGG